MTDSNQQPGLSQEEIDSVINLFSNGQYQLAINQIKVLNQTYPNVPLLFNLIGACYKALGQLQGAVKMFETAVNLKPDYAEAYKNLGISLRDLGQPNDAISCFRKAIEIDPNYVDAYYNLAESLSELNELDASIEAYQKVITLKPDLAEAHNNLGTIFMSIGKFNEAAFYFKKTIKINPNFFRAFNNLGNVFNCQGNFQKGIQCFEKAIAIKPNFAEAHNSLGNIFRRLKQRDKALICYQRAYKIKPRLNFILGSLLNTKMHLCIWDDLPSQLQDLQVRINNQEKVIGPFNLMGLIDDSMLQFKNSELFSQYHYPKINALPEIIQYQDHLKIRIGYFSADFREHPVSTLTAELYELHDREHFEIHAFSFGPDTKDEMNLRIKDGVDYFHHVQAKSHKEIAELARSLEIDIAIDLGGHTAKSRPDIFALSAAPVQLSYLGFLGTMGAEYYDYLIADPMMIPEENHKYFTEKIVYLPNFQVTNSTELPPKITLTRKDVGLPEEGFVFCCFNNTYKFTPQTFDSWARILKQVEGSVLIIYADNSSAEVNLAKEIKARGVDSKRLIFGKRLERPEYMARYRVADLFLDTQPCNAGTTAVDALRMGLPIITLAGQSFVSREAASIVNAVNLPELITHSREEYESLAIELASNPKKLKRIKDKLAANLSTAPLYDTKLFTKNLESAYTQMYERHHQGLEPDHIYVE